MKRIPAFHNASTQSRTWRFNAFLPKGISGTPSRQNARQSNRLLAYRVTELIVNPGYEKEWDRQDSETYVYNYEPSCQLPSPVDPSHSRGLIGSG